MQLSTGQRFVVMSQPFFSCSASLTAEVPGRQKQARTSVSLSVCLWWKRRDRQTDRKRTKRFACQIAIGLSWELRCAGLCSTSAPVGKLLKSWNVASVVTQLPRLRECSFTAARPSLLSIFHPLPASALLSRFLPVQWQTQQMSKRSPPSAACLSEVLGGNWDVENETKQKEFLHLSPSF